jgi:hypothetical protein
MQLHIELTGADIVELFDDIANGIVLRSFTKELPC